MESSLPIVGYACGIGAGKPGCEDAPTAIDKSQCLTHAGIEHYWHAHLTPDSTLDTPEAIAKISAQLSQTTQELTRKGKPFVVIGGDHSSGIGTWSGTASAIDGPLGLIWSDAHLDAHTFETTPSGNIHGMPVAALLGHGDSMLTHIGNKYPAIQPEHLCFIGARDYEAEEYALLQSLNVRIIDHHEIQSRGLQECLHEAIDLVSRGTAGFGLSIDLDGFDPSFAPAVGTPVEQGIDPQDFCNFFTQNPVDQLLGIEIVEYNPHLDREGQTLALIPSLIKSTINHK